MLLHVIDSHHRLFIPAHKYAILAPLVLTLILFSLLDSLNLCNLALQCDAKWTIAV